MNDTAKFPGSVVLTTEEALDVVAADDLPLSLPNVSGLFAPQMEASHAAAMLT